MGLIALVLRKVPLGDLTTRLLALSGPYILALSALTTLQVAITALRLWRILQRLGERVSLVVVTESILVGLAYNMLLPTSMGGDVLRALYLRKHLEAPHRAWSSGLYDRIASLSALACAGIFGLLFGAQHLGGLPERTRLVAVAFGLTVIAAFLFASYPFRILVRVLGARMPAAARDDLEGLTSDLQGVLATPSVRIEALSWSLLHQGVACAFAVVGAMALGDSAHAPQVAIGMPIVYLLSMLPLTIGGHGLREGVYLGVLGALGVLPGVALGLSALWLASSLLFAGIGALLVLRKKA